jgi:hypothetical protein
MAKRNNHRQSQGNGRLSWDGRLWDPNGNLYEETDEELDRRQAAELLEDSEIQVAIAACSASLRWLSPGERRTVWSNEIVPNFCDQPAPIPSKGLPFHADVWRSGENTVLLLTERN